MKIYYSNSHKEHSFGHPKEQADDNGGYFEVPKRVHSILSSLNFAEWAEIIPPQDFGEEPILQIHSSKYLEYLKHAYEDWKIFSNEPGMAFIPYTPGFDPQATGFVEISDQDGFFMTDMNVPVNPDTYNAAIRSAHCALSAAQTVALHNGASFAICRPPGHHAGSEICGGFCYLNNAAIAAQWLSKRGKVAILDIDYHAGNGTQAIFYERPDVLTISLHADPAWEYPSFAGYASEIGSGPGEGYHRNFPLPHQTGDDLYRQTLDQALQLLNKFSPDFLVVSAGFDTFYGDPLGDFKITRDGYSIFGKMISDLKLPTAIILEGGYKIDELGNNVVAFLKSFASK
jgi:acetoin utilization deacetylase AcuC-like enzyme